MRFGNARTVLGGFSDEAAHDLKVKEARLEVAKSSSEWRELEVTALVRRWPYLVHADSYELFAPYRGVVWATRSSSPIADKTPLHYFIDREGEVIFLERKPGTWSEIVEKRERRKRRVA